MDRVILHCDLNNFFASVECVLNPELKNKPIAVCGNKENRSGIVLAKNELAKKYGVKTTDIIYEAQKKCANIVIVPPHYSEYSKYSNIVREIYKQYTDEVESFGLDECWLDITGSQKLFGNGEEIANIIREEVKAKTGLTVSVGVSFNKTFAKLGSDLKKPDAVSVINRDNYKQLLWELPANDMLFIGGRTYEKLRQMGIITIGDLARASTQLLIQQFGINGEKMIQLANGNDDSRVQSIHETRVPKSVSHGTTLPYDTTSKEVVHTIIHFLSDLISERLRRHSIYICGVGLTVKNNNLETVTKQCALLTCTNTSEAIAKTAIDIFEKTYSFQQQLPVRALTVFTYKVSSTASGEQLSIFEQTNEFKTQALERTIDNLREKYGWQSVTRGSYTNNDFLMSKITDENLTDENLLPFKKD